MGGKRNAEALILKCLRTAALDERMGTETETVTEIRDQDDGVANHSDHFRSQTLVQLLT